MLIYHANLNTVEGFCCPDGYVTMEQGVITGFGSMADCPPVTAGDVDAGGRLLLPGFVDAHCHLGLFTDGHGYGKADVNEETDPITPQLQGWEGVYPLDPTFREAREAGITTVVTGPGSTNVIAGQLAAIKTTGRWIDQMLVKAPLAMKVSLGENPKGTYGGSRQSPMTRMATAALLRETLRRAQRYARQLAQGETPDYDPKLEALVPVVEGRLPVHFHAHRADDIATAVRLGEEFGLDYRILHATEGYLVADILAQKGVGVITGPLITDRSKPELARMQPSAPAALVAAGVKVAICTDHPELPIQHLAMSAALCLRHGMTPEQVLRAITLTAAELAGIADRAGSIAVGKDADLVLWSGDPFAPASRPVRVWIRGEQVVG
jgi:imidazolonepropionase-like amidohydrolase